MKQDHKNLYYRFRGTQSLFDYKELEQQSIYFANPEEFNDPMEGFHNLTFNGDYIVFKNLFKHYLMCLFYSYMVARSTDKKLSENDIPVLSSYKNFPIGELQESFNEISEEVFLYNDCNSLIKALELCNWSMQFEEIYSTLSLFHIIALPIIYKYFQGEINKSYLQKKELIQTFKEFLDSDKEPYPKNLTEFSELIQKMLPNFYTVALTDEIYNHNYAFVAIDYVTHYLSQLKYLTYPKGAIACFSSDYTNSSMWGNYADGHKGICLIFEASENNTIKFQSGENIFQKVEYAESFIETNFFQSMGMVQNWVLQSAWLTDSQDKKSLIYDEIYGDNHTNWQKIYQNNITKNYLRKTEDWKFEKEYRLIESDILSERLASEQRIKKYDFNTLKGIIFGMQISPLHKSQIVKIIQKKCQETGRIDFDFYQAYYSQKHHKIKKRLLSIWNFET